MRLKPWQFLDVCAVTCRNLITCVLPVQIMTVYAPPCSHRAVQMFSSALPLFHAVQLVNRTQRVEKRALAVHLLIWQLMNDCLHGHSSDQAHCLLRRQSHWPFGIDMSYRSRLHWVPDVPDRLPGLSLLLMTDRRRTRSGGPAEHSEGVSPSKRKSGGRRKAAATGYGTERVEVEENSTSSSAQTAACAMQTINVARWLEENQKAFLPPVCNKMMYKLNLFCSVRRHLHV